MKINKVTALYFSPCGNVRLAAEAVAKAAAETLNCEFEALDITLPLSRRRTFEFEKGELVVVGSPVYAGRVPNKIMPFFKDAVKTEGALAVSLVCYGGRNFDNALSELAGILEGNGFVNIAGSAVVTSHSFSQLMQPGRPDQQDLADLADFGAKCGAKAAAASDANPAESSVKVPGEYQPEKYYTPLKLDGSPAVFLKAAPKTDIDKCNHCGKCSAVCPMGVIDRENVHNITGPCIKCMACIKYCRQGAKYFVSEDLESHIAMLEANYTAHKDSLFCL